jgi:endonuclease YncB( thermonuclease family)
MIIPQNLQEATYDSVPIFSLEGLIGVSKVVRVHDGDTIWVVFPIHDILYKIKIRLDGLDTPELKNPEGKGQVAKNYLESIVLNKLIKIVFMKYDKYGRPLAKLYTLDTQECINDKLIQMGYAKPYFGGKKEDN